MRGVEQREGGCSGFCGEEGQGCEREGVGNGEPTGCAPVLAMIAATFSELSPSFMGFAASIPPSSSTRMKATPGDPAFDASLAMSPCGESRGRAHVSRVSEISSEPAISDS